MILADQPAVILAPMEGVTDAPMRAVQGAIGGYSFAVSEFLRITQLTPPAQVFYRHMPELRTGSRTGTGLLVQLQLLGGDEERMAESALRGVTLGAAGIDINFGCPAPTVNRHDGGATLLKYPKRIRSIVAAVRSVVPRSIPVSAKLRLGWDSTNSIDENAAMAAEGGASWITLHGRTRKAGYAPPIYWEPIGRVRRNLSIPVVANGDITSVNDFLRCQEVTGCCHYMLGRGAVADPRLARQVSMELGLCPRAEMAVIDWPTELRRFITEFGSSYPRYLLCRLKQWLHYASRFGHFTHFDAVKRLETVENLLAAVDSVCRA